MSMTQPIRRHGSYKSSQNGYNNCYNRSVHVCLSALRPHEFDVTVAN